MDGRERYFAYGSNLSRAQMAERCPGAVALGVALLPGHRLAFTRYSSRRGGGVADAVAEPGSAVWGLLYAVTPMHLAALDHCEGHPHSYRRAEESVERVDGAVETAWAYTVVDKRDFVAPTATYLGTITEAAQRLGLPDDYVGALHAVPTTDG